MADQRFTATLGGGDSRPRSAARRNPRVRQLSAARVSLFALILAALLGLILLPNYPAPRQLAVGALSPRTYRASRDLSFESAVLTEQRRREAAESVPQVLSFDPEVRPRQLARFDQIAGRIDEVRNSAELRPSEKLNALTEIPGLELTSQSSLLLLSYDEPKWQQVAADARRLLDTALQTLIAPADLRAVRSSLSDRLPASLEALSHPLVVELVGPLVVPNQHVDLDRTEEEREIARASVTPFRVNLARDQVIIQQSGRVDEATLEALKEAGLLDPGLRPKEMAGLAIMSALVSLILGWYLYLFQPKEAATLRRLAMLVLLFAGTVAVTRIALPLFLPDTGGRSLQFAIPVATAPMLVAALLSVRLGVLVAALLAALISFAAAYAPDSANFLPNHPLDSLRLCLVYLFSGLAGVLSVHGAERFSRYLLAGILVGGAAWVVLATFWLLEGAGSYRELGWMTAAAAMGGFLSALITLGSFVILSTAFGITTRLQLMELAQLNSPLLRRLQDEAPGTFHHSIIVSNLAERAADLIQADSLLVRVGSYYHDIGKVMRPGFYIENQMGGENPHDSLDALTSARIIAEHVKGGLELEKRHRVPAVVQQFTGQHHGTRLVTYFYRKAALEDPDIDPELFLYPGPRPQSKEAGIVMLADSVEATVRSAPDRSQERIAEIVDDVIAERIAEGQLDDSELTLGEIRVIAECFKSTLSAVYHPRIEYPAPTPAEKVRMAAPGPLPAGATGLLAPPPIPMDGQAPPRTERSRERA